MTHSDHLVHRGVFATLDDTGDIGGRPERDAVAEGLFARDTRHLSLWRLRVDGASPTRLAAGVLTPPGTRDRPPHYAAFREQAVAAWGLAERVRLVNHTGARITARVRYDVDADFADQFELRADDRSYAKPDARRTRETTTHGLVLGYQRADWHVTTSVLTDPPAHRTLDNGPHPALEWDCAVAPHSTATITLNVCVAGATNGTVPGEIRAPGEVSREVRADTEAFARAIPIPQEHTGDPGLARARAQGMADLAALRVPARGPDGEDLLVPGAGVPWFLTLFGRDSLLTSYFALRYRPGTAAATLAALAATQGTRHNPTRLEQPGRIVHEVRDGELGHLGQVPYARYYGTVDATPLFLVLLHEYTTVTGDNALAVRLEPHARAAVTWMRTDGGLDDQGYLWYTPDPEGLANQCWKDSRDAICFRDGTPAEGPIAVCEAQGYAYDALRRTADLAARVWGDGGYAKRLRVAADRLRARFLQDFPLPTDDGFPALALDGRGHQVDARASNAGHLLWSGMLDTDTATAVGHQLLRPDFFSGWGVRTLAAGQPAYHPLSYHRGSVWPHDTAIVAAGLLRYGLREQARWITRGLIEAAEWCGHRLPEVIAGYGPGEHPAPVVYPHSCSPQAWAAVAPLALPAS